MTNQHQRLWTSECPAELADFYRECVCGQQAAWEFLLAYHRQAHRLDDMVDGELGCDAETILRLTRDEQVLWGMPFYRAHERELGVVSCLVRSLYGNSELWKVTDGAARRPHHAMADTLRFACNLMIEACALLCGGYDHQRRVSQMIWTMSWAGHHDVNGKPV